MFKGVRRFLCGWREVNAAFEDSAKLLDIMYRAGVCFDDEKRLSCGDISIAVRESGWKIISPLFEKENLCVRVSEVRGLPKVLKFMKARPMLPVGFLLFTIWMLYSSHIVWDINIDGNTKTDSREIISLLDELGFGLGTYYPAVDFNRLHAEYAASQHDIAWLSVFMNGTVAEIQVRELYADTRNIHSEGVYANIVAECDGIVEDINVFEGQACVKPGDLVRRGQVLISGIVEGKNGEFRYEYASGEVFCTSASSISEKVSLVQDKKVFTGRKKTEISIKFFKKMINLYIKGGIEYDVYDKIDTMEQLCPFGLCEIPVWIEKTVYREFEYIEEKISPEKAAELAMTSLNKKIREEIKTGELEKKEIRTDFTEGEYVINCMLYLRKNIGRVSEFNVTQ